MTKQDLRIIFLGTPDFATASLRALVEGGYNVVAVVTMPDKPAGRGHQLQFSDVKKYAIVTSGSSSYFPEGIMVGTVAEATPLPDGLCLDLKVKLNTSFSQLEHAFVVRKMDAEELEELKELLKPKKKKK